MLCFFAKCILYLDVQNIYNCVYFLADLFYCIAPWLVGWLC